MYYLNFSFVVLVSAAVAIASAAKTYPRACTAVAPAPTGCGIAGTLKYNYKTRYAAGSPQVVDTLEDCAALCAGREDAPTHSQTGYYAAGYYVYSSSCASFSFDNNTKICQIGQFETKRVVKPSPKSYHVFYDANCFNCGKFCPQPYGAQLVANGDFEGKLLGPWASYGGNLAEGHNSRHSFRCANRKGPTGGCELRQEMNMCDGAVYFFQFDYLLVRENDTSKASSMTLTFEAAGPYGLEIGGDFVYSLKSNNTTPGAWKTAQGYFMFSNTSWLGPDFLLKSNGISTGRGVFLDNVYIARVPSSPELVHPQKSIIPNGGFESGELAPWRTRTLDSYEVGQFRVVRPGIGSRHGLFFNSHNLSTSDSPDLIQTIQTTPRTTYLFSFDAVISQDYFQLVFTFGSVDDEYSYTRRLLKGNYSFSMPVYAKSSRLRFQVQASDFLQYRGDEHSTLLLDNFKMVEIAQSKFFP